MVKWPVMVSGFEMFKILQLLIKKLNFFSDFRNEKHFNARYNSTRGWAEEMEGFGFSFRRFLITNPHNIGCNFEMIFTIFPDRRVARPKFRGGVIV